ncbi:terminase large subunit domain-containing protein [Aeromicrobium sp. Leaf291]|uniref:terminase large subunit domain-containing protein n=1 Tax=Aeromicrobium sp. Leaf291 TaxID=1736325 RepID=UPI0006F2EBAC|nr:terminase family protein [Aeromicrobium sp. Leaf291]KQP83752.1 hypothetical protein ASF35_01875 [Aeromicrobium sp. Leaf291]
MTKPGTAPATDDRSLSAVARHVVAPDGIRSTEWPSVGRTCHRLGWGFDRWQSDAGRLILAKRVDGTYAADTTCISIPRQAGKTYLIACIIFALCLLKPGLTVIWTAHRKTTARETFDQFDGMAKRPKVAAHVRQVLHGKGDEAIHFNNGSRILFGARESGFGRGFAGVDVLVCDEGQILPESTLEDLGATQNTAPNPLFFVMGTPPRPRDAGEFFTLLRQEALDGDSESTLYIETSADRGTDPMDPDQLRKANPSYPHRSSHRAMLRLRKKLRNEDSWNREARGIWDRIDLKVHPVDPFKWAELADEDSVPAGTPDYYSLSISPERIGFIGVAFHGGDGPDFLDLAEAGRVDDSRKIIEWFTERRPCKVAIDGRDPAAALVNELRAAKVKVNVTTQSDSARASLGFSEAVAEGRVAHVDQPTVREALVVARKKLVGKAGLWEFDPDDDIAALRAITLARYGLTFKNKRTGDGRRTGTRRGVVL